MRMMRFEGFSENLLVGGGFLMALGLPALVELVLAVLLAGKTGKVEELHLSIVLARRFAVLDVYYHLTMTLTVIFVNIIKGSFF